MRSDRMGVSKARRFPRFDVGGAPRQPRSDEWTALSLWRLGLGPALGYRNPLQLQ